MPTADAIADYLSTVAPIGAAALIILAAILQKTMLAELNRRGMPTEVASTVRKLIGVTGLLLVVIGVVWTLERAGVISLEGLRRYSVPLSITAVGLALAYLYRPPSKR